MNKLEDRIAKIKKEHITLLKMVKDSLSQSKDNFNEEVVKAIQVLNADEEDVKKYEALTKAQALIVNLTEQIVNSTSPEEIANLRKKLNYYINKIKTILKNRNIEESQIETYISKTTSFRKDISKYIRVLKRENNISFITNSSANYDNLSIDEQKELQKVIRRENSYNNRSLNPKEKKNKGTEAASRTLALVPLSPVSPENVIEESFSLTPSFEDDETNVTVSHKSISELEFSEVGRQFAHSAAILSSQYHLAPTLDYHRNAPLRNLVNFFRNIPGYIYNKKALKAMIKDSNIYYRGSDIISFIEYVRQRNSISQGLKCIFSRSYLYTKEADCLNHHNQCAQWLFDYCKEQSLEVPFHYFDPKFAYRRV